MLLRQIYEEWCGDKSTRNVVTTNLQETLLQQIYEDCCGDKSRRKAVATNLQGLLSKQIFLFKYSFCSQVPVLRPGFYTLCIIFGRMPGFEPELLGLQPGVLPVPHSYVVQRSIYLPFAPIHMCFFLLIIMHRFISYFVCFLCQVPFSAKCFSVSPALVYSYAFHIFVSHQL